MQKPKERQEIQFAIPEIQSTVPSASSIDGSSHGLAIDGGASQSSPQNMYDQMAKAYFHQQQQYPDFDMGSAQPMGDIATNTSVMDGDKYITHTRVNGQLYNPYTKQSGSKATRNYNPGNITGMGGKLLYGAHRISRSSHGDKGDQSQLVFGSARDGWRAMRSLMGSSKYNNAPIRQAFAKWQTDQSAWQRQLSEMGAKGINSNNTFNQLSIDQQMAFMRMRAAHEGYRGQDVNTSMFA